MATRPARWETSWPTPWPRDSCRGSPGLLPPCRPAVSWVDDGLGRGHSPEPLDVLPAQRLRHGGHLLEYRLPIRPGRSLTPSRGPAGSTVAAGWPGSRGRARSATLRSLNEPGPPPNRNIADLTPVAICHLFAGGPRSIHNRGIRWRPDVDGPAPQPASQRGAHVVRHFVFPLCHERSQHAEGRRSLSGVGRADPSIP